MSYGAVSMGKLLAGLMRKLAEEQDDWQAIVKQWMKYDEDFYHWASQLIDRKDIADANEHILETFPDLAEMVNSINRNFKPADNPEDTPDNCGTTIDLYRYLAHAPAGTEAWLVVKLDNNINMVGKVIPWNLDNPS